MLSFRGGYGLEIKEVYAMKKFLSLLAALSLLLCGLALAEDAAAPQVGVYTIYNKTGEKIVSLSLTDNVTGETVSYLEDGAYLAVNAGTAITATLPAGEDGNHRYTLKFATESGYEGSFATLSNEVVPMTLLAADALTGATPFTFTAAEKNAGLYTIYNKTGEAVTELIVTDNVTGQATGNYALKPIADGDSVIITLVLDEKEDGSHRYTLSFKTEGGYEAKFATLSNEVAPITLLAADALTGATPISFSAPEAK